MRFGIEFGNQDTQIILDRMSKLEAAMNNLTTQFAAQVATLRAGIKGVGTSVDAAIGRVSTDVTALTAVTISLQAKVDELQAQVDAGDRSPELLASLSEAVTELNELKTKIDTQLDPTKPPVEVPPTEPTEPTEPTPTDGESAVG